MRPHYFINQLDLTNKKGKERFAEAERFLDSRWSDSRNRVTAPYQRILLLAGLCLKDKDRNTPIRLSNYAVSSDSAEECIIAMMDDYSDSGLSPGFGERLISKFKSFNLEVAKGPKQTERQCEFEAILALNLCDLLNTKIACHRRFKVMDGKNLVLQDQNIVLDSLDNLIATAKETAQSVVAKPAPAPSAAAAPQASAAAKGAIGADEKAPLEYRAAQGAPAAKPATATLAMGKPSVLNPLPVPQPSSAPAASQPEPIGDLAIAGDTDWNAFAQDVLTKRAARDASRNSANDDNFAKLFDLTLPANPAKGVGGRT